MGMALRRAQEFDTRGVDEHVKTVTACAVRHMDVQRFLPAAHRAVVGCRPRQPSKTQQRLHPSKRLTQRQPEQAFDRQAKLDGSIGEGLVASSFAARRSVPLHVLVQPDSQITSSLQRRVVFLPVRGAVTPLAPARFTHTPRLPRLWGHFVQQRPTSLDQPDQIGEFLSSK